MNQKNIIEDRLALRIQDTNALTTSPWPVNYDYPIIRFISRNIQ